MSDAVKPRRYDASRRQAAAASNRGRILTAARALFLANGFATTTVAAIAERAGVAVDTVYASIGPKPVLFRALIESALSGIDEPVPGSDRHYVQLMHSAADAGEARDLRCCRHPAGRSAGAVVPRAR